MSSPVHWISVDCRDPYELAGFWAQALGGRRQDDDVPGDDEVLVTYPGGTPLLFQAVPEPKQGKNRLHLDLQTDLPREEQVARLTGLGATVLQERIRDDGSGWVVMADPEGNEFCVERSRAERGEVSPGDTGERPLPPIFASDERTMLTGMLDWYREGVLHKVDGLPQDLATTSPVRSGTTVAGLVKHLALVEDAWFATDLAAGPELEPWASAPWDDDRDWEFTSARSEPLADSVALYRAAVDRSRAVAAGLELDHTVTTGKGKTFTLRFALLHLFEETARHLGHLDLLCELADGRTGE